MTVFAEKIKGDTWYFSTIPVLHELKITSLYSKDDPILTFRSYKLNF
jgi:hypothetical protein